MTDNQSQDHLWLMLGEMRGDLKYLVNERRSTNERLNSFIEETDEARQKIEKRLTALEHFKTKIGVITAGLGILVPTVVTFIAHKLELLK